jgi:hypothetical protein
LKERSDSLEELAWQFKHRAWRLIPLIQVAPTPASAESDRLVAYVTIETVNAWASFSRAFYISCAMRAYTANGTRVAISATGLKTPHDALLLAMQKLKNFKKTTFRRRDEPGWHNINHLISMAQHLDASNLNGIVAAFGYSTQAFNCLPTLRNFFAHRNADTCAKCMALSSVIAVPPAKRPADILLHRNYSKPMNLLGEWISDMTHVAYQLVQ